MPSQCLSNNLNNNPMCRNNSNSKRTLRCQDVHIQVAVMGGAQPT